jgi:predicted NAD-dependent protein-ADP-ribosyltransferase YbiA (DUF1768 family)
MADIADVEEEQLAVPPSQPPPAQELPAEEEEEEEQQEEEQQEEEQQEEEEEEVEIPKEEAPKKKEKKAKGEKKERPIPIPKDSKGFFRARRKDVKAFDFTPDGDLQVPEMRGVAAKVIKIPFYTPATKEDLEPIDQKRQVDIDTVEQKYNETLKNLREALVTWRETGVASPVIQFQRQLAVLDAERAYYRSPIHWVKMYKNPSVNKILFDMKFEDRKIGYNLTALKMSSYTNEQLFKKSDVPPPKVLAEGEGKVPAAVKKTDVTYTVFYDPSDPTNGFLSPDTPITFNFNGTRYAFPIQAYEGERLLFLKKLEKRKVVLFQRTAKGVRSTAATIVGQVENPLDLWTRILNDLISQHPQVGERLRETGKDILVYADPKDLRAGVGLAANDPSIKEESKWAGKNLLGKAWMAVRTSLPEVLQEQEGGAYKEDGTLGLQEEAKERKRGVLIHNYRKANGFTG